MIRLRRVSWRGQASRGVVGTPASSPPPLARRGGSVEGDPAAPSAQPSRDFLDDVDLAVAEVQYEKWLSR